MLSYYFYDLETSSGSPHTGRIMQFAGQRTDQNLKPIGEPDNILVKLADDIIPEPDAILVHGITPQKTLDEGLSEAEFAKFFLESVATVGTVFVGFNNIRFDDEFTRRICYRTFNDPYQWHWKDGRGRWDLLDPIRMMRALRPEGMNWPMLKDKPSVKLELMAKENGLTHENAHDALSDVVALIELSQKFRSAQPKLFDYLINMRDKKKVAELVLSEDPFVYTSGMLRSDHEKTSVVLSVFKHPRRDSAVVYDLREDPTKWLDKSVKDLVKHWTVRYGDDTERLPAKVLHFNKCPAVAPLVVLDKESQDRIKIDLEVVEKHRAILATSQEFVSNLKKALDIIEKEQQTKLPLDDSVDHQLYDGFWGAGDQAELLSLRTSSPDELSALIPKTKNKRIQDMIPLYKARNFPRNLSPDEKSAWEQHRTKSLIGDGAKGAFARYSKRMQEIPKERKLTKNEEYLLTELQLYVESILPVPEE
ncbi:MAG: exodeoxyribonuclease-1 [Candidatus Saccharimonadales bacterium]|jgi:exodeoxyribonuclease-1